MPASTSIWILGDQLIAHHPALEIAQEQGDRLQIVFIESVARSRRMPYQRKKLVLLFSAMRHYAASLAEQGLMVDYRQSADSLSGLKAHLQQFNPSQLICMAASEYRGRLFQERLADSLGIPVIILPNTQFLSGQFDPFPDIPRQKRILQESFYRAMRKRYGLLIEANGNPTGNRWNFDSQNRNRLPKSYTATFPITFEPDELTQAVIEEVEAQGWGVGSAIGFDLAVTRAQAHSALQDFIENRLAAFGAYEDAMSQDHPVLFHSHLSPYLNLGLLEPLEVAREAETAYRLGRVPLNSAEGFIRQVIGWREYIYYQYWRQMPELRQANDWNAIRPLPKWFWNGETEMNCLKIVIQRALQTGYSHHIERLMILSNFCLLAGIQPLAVNDWFSALYVDAYEWVMLPNVLGMGLNADGGKIATKPYIASANYIRRMSDYCSGCRFNPLQRTGADACPFNFLYWNFLLSHASKLSANPRMGPAVLGIKRIGEAEREEIQAAAARFLDSIDR